MIEIRQLTKVYGAAATGFKALDNVTVTIESNEFFTLLGPSGCGKTTLLRAIAGFVDPSAGSIHLNGKDLLSSPPYTRPVNTVFQNYALFPHMTVKQNIAFGLEMLDKPKREIEETSTQMLELVRMTEMADRQVSEISGGQQQRVALARALAPKPQVLLLDEPLSALDFKLRKEMQIELKRLQKETGITFVFVTHDQEEALTMSDRIAVMNAGHILQIGSPREIYNQPAERFVADFIGETNFVTAEVLEPCEGGTRVRFSNQQTSIAQRTDNSPTSGKATVAIRPEHARLSGADEQPILQGVLQEVVYFGTDTHYQITLDDGSEFVLRRQNSPGQSSDLNKGDTVGLVFEAGVAQILAD